jgi:DNA-binding beta-propeller fold protein YncE
MRTRKLVLFSLLAVSLGGQAFSQVVGVPVGDGNTAQVTGGKSPSVKVIDAEGKDVAEIPIAENPAMSYDFNKSSLFKSIYIPISAYSKANNTLYILHNEKKGEHFISAVNLTTNRVDKQIPVGAGQEASLLLSSDGNRLYSYTACKPAISCFGEEKYVPPFDPAIAAIDTASNQVVATYHLSDGYHRDELKKRNAFYVNTFLAASDTGVIIQSEVRRLWNGKNESLSDIIMGFSGNSSKPDYAINGGGPLHATMFSKDRSQLFGVISGDKKSPGSLAVFDLKKGALSVHPLSGHPTVLLRLGTDREPWILSDEEMRAFSESGELTERRIALNKSRKPAEGGEDNSGVFLDGFPGETISLGNEYAAMLINRKNGLSHHKVALLNLKDLQVEAILPTISASEKTAILTGRIVASVVVAVASGGTVIVAPNLLLRNESLAARPDGRFLYSLDLDGHEVTIIDVRSATVVRRIPVNGSVARLQLSADSKYLVCFGKKPQQINMETNTLGE